MGWRYVCGTLIWLGKISWRKKKEEKLVKRAEGPAKKKDLPVKMRVHCSPRLELWVASDALWLAGPKHYCWRPLLSSLIPHPSIYGCLQPNYLYLRMCSQSMLTFLVLSFSIFIPILFFFFFFFYFGTYLS